VTLNADSVTYRYDRHGRRARSGETVHDFELHDVSISIPRGSLTGLLGPNGCGKTTLLQLLSGVLQPHKGTVALDGHSLATLSRRATAQRIAVVPQETHPAFDYTAMEMVLMGRHPHLGAFQLEGPEDLAIARDALAATGSAHLAHRSYMTLSGGEKQRVVIAGALAQSPDVLLLDEPTASLDLGYQLEVASLLATLNRERSVTMVLATHDLNLAASLCDTLILLRQGRVLAHGPTRDVLTAPMVHQLYGVEADVTFHERAGHVTVVALSTGTPDRRSSVSTGTPDRRSFGSRR
jgi:iron complex transport system ATP-binding protein